MQRGPWRMEEGSERVRRGQRRLRGDVWGMQGGPGWGAGAGRAGEDQGGLWENQGGCGEGLGGRAFNWGGRGSIEPPGCPPPPQKGSTDGPPKLLLRLTPGSWRWPRPEIQFFSPLKMVSFFPTKYMTNDDFPEPPQPDDSKNLFFILLPNCRRLRPSAPDLTITN